MWPYEKNGERLWQREAIEIKVWRPKKKDPLESGLAQLSGYLSGLGLNQGTLIIFDRREGLDDLEERVSRELLDFENCKIQLIRG